MENCSKCKFWIETGAIDDGVNHCRRYAPAPGSSEARQLWPITKASDWCGEFKALPPAKTAKKGK